jgi:TPR repeat protein
MKTDSGGCGGIEEEEEEEEEECAICLEELSMLHQTTLHCGHMFHTECLEDLKVRGTDPNRPEHATSSCPLCRAPIPNAASSLTVGQQASERYARLMRSTSGRRSRGWEGLTAVERDEMGQVVQLWRQGAFSNGDPSCHYCLGVCSHDGFGAPRDESDAVRHWREATKKGHAKSQYRLGIMYLEGRGGCPQSYGGAERLFALAAAQGHAAAQLSLSQLYLSGRVDVSHQSAYEADRLYHRSAGEGMDIIRAEAADGNVAAQYDLGCFFRDGRDVPQSWSSASDWFRKAALAGHSGAQYELALLCRGRDDVEAVRWLRRAADFGHAGALASLGTVYERGACGIPRDAKEASRLYRLAAKMGDPVAQCNLGRMYMSGVGVRRNSQKAVKIFEQASEQGIAPAQHELASAFEKGAGGLPVHLERALELYAEALANGYAPAELGLCRVRAACERQRRDQKPFQLYVDSESGLVTLHPQRRGRRRRGGGVGVGGGGDVEEDSGDVNDEDEGGSDDSEGVAWRPGTDWRRPPETGSSSSNNSNSNSNSNSNGDDEGGYDRYYGHGDNDYDYDYDYGFHYHRHGEEEKEEEEEEEEEEEGEEGVDVDEPRRAIAFAHRAAALVQRTYRAWAGRRTARRALVATWRKCRDTTTRHWYYENLATGEAQWTPPRLFARLFPESGGW